jgi:SPP1 gp7 family putative phage head morphogenesis protein
LEKQYVNDDYVDTLEEAFEKLRESYVNIKQAKKIASLFSRSVDRLNRDRFISSVEKTIGIDLNRVVESEKIEDVLKISVRENVSLIRSIPEQYLKNIESIVYSGTVQGSAASSMIKLIQKAGGVSKRRAKRIARDQTSKLNSALTQKRSQVIGATEYIWRTAGDDRVRSTHKANNGQVFRWDDPPKKTGHPGHDIQCRCIAQPIIKM